MSTETVNPKFNGNDSPEKLSSEFNGKDSSEKLNDEFNGNDSSESPKPQLNVQDSSEQLNAKLNSEDISEKLNAESNEQDSSEKKVNLPEKRKREETETHTNPLWKTALCSYFRRNEGSCSHGESCRYAHGESELRIRPDNTWDPTSQRAKKIARIEFEEEEDEEQVKCNDVMMPDALDDDDGQRSSSSGLSKCLVNLPMKWNSDNLRCFLKEHGVTYKSAKKKKGMSVGFVTLENAEQVETAVKELDGLPFRNKILKVGDVVPRAFERKGNSAMSSFPTNQHGEKQTQAGDGLDLTKILDETEAEDQTANDSVLMGRCVRDVVTPLAKMPYADQLEQKKSSLTRTLKTLTRNARKACPDGVPLPEWILKARDIGGLPCNLEGITESPLVNGYRNKCEFSVGYSVLGKPTVGFLPGNFREGVTAVEEPVDCPNVSEIACKYAAVFQEFLQQSTLPIWNRLNNTGFWRQLTVREGRMPGENVEVENPSANISEVMLIVQVSTLDFDDSLVNDELQGLAKAFAVGASSASPTLPLTALVVQDHTGISNVAPADAPLRWLPFPGGEDSAVAEAKIHDFVNGLKFCISPTAFFQVNTLAAEKLYSLAGDWASLGPDTLLFDICCGTGTIGLTLANRVGMVVGIEMNASAVSDAQRNAEINGIKNCRFICGKAEDVIGSVLKEYLVSPPKVDGLRDIKEKNNQENTISTGKTDCIVNASEADEESGIGSENGKGMCIDPDSAPIVNMDSTDNTLEPEGKAGNRKSLSESSSDGIIESETQLKNCSSENLTTPVQHFKNVVAIVDPPRAGLHPTVIKLLRTNSRLRRLVYISCNPETLVANAIELCTPSPDETAKGNNRNNRLWKRMSSATLARHRTKSMPNSEPFQPVKAMAVDLFPHTPHCELVMLLER
ncbi:zinc finger CCCH domain-containing protein 24 [Capsicum annuum]|uniref:zinc finger CCCH domain-containing protein 24 n=1 Tax=Capsicum annuum TaxID=4072 RepID=UPI0007BFB59A|nr:zinc finger CCCH domain-containing protein 24 [Capsicum annuum]